MEFIPKHYILTNPVFQEKPFINWSYTDTILVTAYDLLKNESLLYYLDSNSLTLREFMAENGFPRETRIMADSGVFSLEWFKMIKGRTFDTDYTAIKLKPSDVLYAYELIDPDFLCPLDEIILPTDNKELIKKKKETIKNNILLALEHMSIALTNLTTDWLSATEADFS